MINKGKAKEYIEAYKAVFFYYKWYHKIPIIGRFFKPLIMNATKGGKRNDK